jgi:uncharacterized protein
LDNLRDLQRQQKGVVMKTIREKIDIFLEQFGYWVFDRPWKTMSFVGLFLIISISFIPFVKIDVTTQGNFQKADEVLKRYADFKKQFGSDTSVVIALYPDNIFDLTFLKQLNQLHQDLEEQVPYVDEVTSLINITAIKGEDGQLDIEDLFDTWPKTEAELQGIKAYVFNHPDYVNNIISKEGDYTLIQVRANVFLEEGEDDFNIESAAPEKKKELYIVSLMKKLHGEKSQKIEPGEDINEKTELTNVQNNEIVKKVNEIVEKYQSDKFPLFVTGGPVIDKLHVDVIGATVRKTIGISIICIFFLLFFIFRRLSGVFIPLLIVLLSLVTTFGVMVMLDIPLRVTSQAFPPLVLTAGICDAVHLFSIFYQRLRHNDDKREAIVYALKHSGLAMVFTTLTTAGGFLSFIFADLKGIAEMGASAAIGVTFALVYSFLLIPALIAILPIKVSMQSPKQFTKRGWEKLMESVASFAVTKPYVVLIPTVLIIIVSSFGATNIKFSFNMIKWFPKEVKVDVYNTILEEKFKSTSSLELVVDTGKANGLFEPIVMNAIESAQEYAKNFKTDAVHIGKTVSIVNSLKLINKTLNNNHLEFYSIPQDKKIIAQEMILFENSGWDNLEEIVDNQFSKARITFGVPTVNAVEYVPFGNQIKKDMEQMFKGIAKVSLTGNVDIGARNILGLMKSLTESYLLAFVIIGILMILLLGSIRIGLVSMIPNFLPILIALGIMGFFSISITMFSVLLGGIALGLAVDDTIHFLHNFKRSFDNNNSIIASVIETVRTTGRALFFTTIVMSIGFASYLTADMNILVDFGIIISTTIVLAFLADIIVTPALMAIVYASKER